MIGQLVGNYRIIQLLGEGGMGAVYLAEHPGIGRKAAVKVLHPAYAAEQEFVGRFFNEARAANATRHPGIVEIFDFGTLPSGASYIIMELLEGESLAARLRRAGGAVDLELAVDVVWQAASALGAAHAKGIVHRDLKPDNMYLVPDVQNPGHLVVKILDFGIAKLAGSGQMSGGSMRTRTGAVMGTPVYMSPEQCRGTKEVDHRTDLYALGIILYEMLCGTPPFVSEGFGEMTFLHISAAPPPPRSKNPRIPERVERIILKMLAKDPADRLQSAADVQQALRPTTGRPPIALDAPPASPALASPTSVSGADLRASARSDSGVQAGGTHVLPQGSHAQSTTTFSDAAGVVEPSTMVVRRRRWLIPVVLAGAAAAVAGVVVKSRLAAQAEDAATASAGAATAPTVVPPRAEAPRTVLVAIDSTPAGARLVRKRDGAVLGTTPFKETWSAGNGTETITVEKDGFRAESLVVPMDHGLTFTVELATDAPAPKPAVAEPAATHAKPGRRKHGGGGTASPAAPASPSPAAKPAEEPVPL